MAARSETLEVLLQLLIGQLTYRVLEQRGVEFSCTCSKTRLGDILATLSKKEIAELISEGKAEIVCHFCNESYLFSLEDLEQMRDKC